MTIKSIQPLTIPHLADAPKPASNSHISFISTIPAFTYDSNILLLQ